MEIRSLRIGRLDGIVVAFATQRPFRDSGTSRYDLDVHDSTGHRKNTGDGGTFLRADRC